MTVSRRRKPRSTTTSVPTTEQPAIPASRPADAPAKETARPVEKAVDKPSSRGPARTNARSASRGPARGGARSGDKGGAAEAANTPAREQPAAKPQRRWFKADLHMHTPASNDYEDPQISYLEWLKIGADRGLEIIAVTDHNTVAGVAAMRREIEWLARLEQQNRMTESEREALAAWRELANRVLVLPGFEFTATFGFHILAIFPPETSIRTLEHILLSLKVPPDKLDLGSTETGASTDVLSAYKIIRDAGGLVIAAHANSTHGVAMRDFPFGGQTKIAYTQDVNLDALEVTDLEQRGHSTARFFNGSKTEYPRRMHCIQGSDSHRINTDPRNPKRLGVGERASELMLDEASFEALAALLRSSSFDRTRPARPKDKPFDPLLAARDEGPSIVQSFHESAVKTGGKLDAILNDICAFANTAGGSVYVGASMRKDGPTGLSRPKQVEDQILEALEARLTPPLDVRIDVVKSDSASILRVRVPKGEDRPYCLDDYKFYVRDEGETSMAVRDEIIAMVLETMGQRSVEMAPGLESAVVSAPDATPGPRSEERSVPAAATSPEGTTSSSDAFYLPQIGVEIVETEERHGNKFHSIRDLRNGTIIKNVTRKGARDLWNYAIRNHEDGKLKPSNIRWMGNIGLVHMEKRAGKVRYDLALREGEKTRVFYGVTEDGMEGPWSAFLQEE